MKRTTQHATTRRWLTQAEAAQYLGVTDRTIRNLIARGEIRGYRLGSRTIRIDAHELDATLRLIPSAVTHAS